jgi:hypothetical protein
MSFNDVKNILDGAIAGWKAANGGGQPDLIGQHKNPSFKWDTKDQLLAASARGVQLIQPDVIGKHKGAQANLVVALSRPDPNGGANGSDVGGVINPATGQGFGQMPAGGPYLAPDAIQTIIDWIDNGCLD